MNKEVSFPIAKLLKEKGFDENCKFGYCGSFEPHHIGLIEFGYLQKNSELLKLTYTAPTIAEVLMWFYEKYKIWISVGCDVYGKLWYAKSTVASKSLWEDEDKRHEVLTSFRKFPNEHDTPTKAYEAAILYTLNNLI